VELEPVSDESAIALSQSILVLGPHRSGTSALTRVLNLLGVDLGSEMLPPKFDNQQGYWEHRAVFELHERLLSRAGSAWHDYRPMPSGWQELEDVEAIRHELVALLKQEFQGKPLWGVKDPRACRLVPLWLDTLEELGADLRFVIVVRNPLEVVRSLERRNQFSHAKCVLLCLSDMLAAVVDTEGRPRAFVSYYRLLEDWRQVMDKVADQLGIDWPEAPATRAAEVDAFLVPSERHHRCDLDQLRSDPGFPPWAVELYEALERASQGDTTDLPRCAREAKESFESAATLFFPEMDHLIVENHRLSIEIESLRHEDSVAERLRLEQRAERTERELEKVQGHLTSILSSPLYRSTRGIRRAWRGLTRFNR